MKFKEHLFISGISCDLYEIDEQSMKGLVEIRTYGQISNKYGIKRSLKAVDRNKWFAVLRMAGMILKWRDSEKKT